MADVKKRVTSSDVAKRAGVSRSLVSACLNGTPGITVSEDNRAAIMNAIKELNYTVNVQAKGIKTGRSSCIGVYGEVYNALLLQLVEGIQSASDPAGYHVLLYGKGSGPEGRKDLISLCRQGRIDGLITLDYPDPLSPEWEEAVREEEIPYVSVEGMPSGTDIASVRTDYRESVTRALDDLWERTGIPPVFFQVLPHDRAATQGDLLRRTTYLDWMKGKGLDPAVIESIDDPSEAQISDNAKRLLSLPKPIAVLSNWSRGAVALYRSAYETKWKIGRDLFVMAADDTERVSRHLTPALPCMEVPYHEMGKQAFRILSALMDDKEHSAIDRRAVVPCNLYAGIGVLDRSL